MSYCPTCGNKIEANSIYCSKCGSKTNEIMHNDQGSNFAIIGLILGIISLFFSWTIVIPIVGLHFCKKGEKSEYKNYAYVGKILNLIALIIWLIAILFFIIFSTTIMTLNWKQTRSIQDSKVINSTNNNILFKSNNWSTSIGTLTIKNKSYKIRLEPALGFSSDNLSYNELINNNIIEIKEVISNYFRIVEDPYDEDNIKSEIKYLLNANFEKLQVIDVRFMVYDIEKN